MAYLIKLILRSGIKIAIVLVIISMWWLASFKPNLNPYDGNGNTNPDADMSCQETHDCYFGN